MTGKVENKGAFGAFPFLDVIAASRTRSERVFSRMDRQRPNGLFVVRQGHR